MADKRIKGITIQIGAETKGLDNALKEVEKGANTVKSELRDVERALKAAPDSAVLWAQKQELLTKALEESKKKLELLEKAQQQVNEKFNNKEIGEEQYRAFQREVERARAEVGRFEGQLSDLQSTANNAAENVEDAGNAAEDAGEQAEESGNGGFTVLKGSLSNLVSEGIKKAIDGFKELATEGEAALNSLQAKTGATAEQMETYKDVITNLYANNYGEDKGDIADSIAEVTQQLGELDSESLEDVTEKAFLLRDTFGFEVNESIRAANMLIQQFGVTADEAYTLIAQGAQNGLNKNGDLMDVINEYGVHYKQMGYSAEEFFNSLENGTAAGTFSVDKLGDAMKEFGIRSKDGSDSTAGAFATLGIIVGDNSKLISEAQDKSEDYKKTIADLEQKLKYAEIEQSNFNEKTSELQKMKMEDNIAKWTEELEKSKAELSSNEETIRSLQESASKGGQTAEELFAKFADGGDSAKEATKEVLGALFSMDDKVAQDAAGVALFGTMWEDLGADAVKALTNTEGEADKTAKTLENIADIKYDDLGSRFEKLGRKARSELLEPLAEKYLPKVENGLDWIIKRLPKIEDTTKTMLPYVVGVGAAFATWKAASAISSTVTAIRNLSSAVKAGNTVMQALNLTMNLNPAVAITTAIVGLTAATVAFVKQNEPFKTEIQKDIDKEKELREKVEEAKKSYDEKKDAALDAAGADEAQLGKAQDLWKELQTLADESGHVKDKDKERAEYILHELSEACDEEYKMVDNQIQKYGELKNSIDEVIQKKKASILLNSLESSYTDALTNASELESQQIDKQEEINEQSKVVQSIKRSDGSNFTEQDYIDYYENGLWDTDVNFNNWLENYEKLLALKDTYNTSEEILREYYQDIYNYETAEQEMLQGNYDKAIEIIDKKGKAFQKASELTEKSAEEQKRILSKQYSDSVTELAQTVKRYKDKVAGYTDETVRQAIDKTNRAKKELEELHYSSTEVMQNSAIGVQEKIGSVAADIVDNVTNTMNILDGLFQTHSKRMAQQLLIPTQNAMKKIGGAFGLNLPFMAEGGTLTQGSAIVAEAGPELISIMNGGVQVTPLTDSAKNTALNQVSSKPTVKNYYFNNVINAKISNDYDVHELSHKLSVYQKQIEAGRGNI